MLDPWEFRHTSIVHESDTVSVEPSPTLLQRFNRTVAGLMLVLIGFYRRFISPMIGPRCRFTPTCSAYGLEAIQKHGPWKGAGSHSSVCCGAIPSPPVAATPFPIE